MAGTYYGQPLTFDVQQGSDAPGGYRMVLSFEAGRSGIGLCQGGQATGPRVGASLSASLAFCASNTTIGSAYGWADVADTTDPSFSGLLTQLVFAVSRPHERDAQPSDEVAN